MTSTEKRCGVRCYDHETKDTMTCTLPRGHAKNVHHPFDDKGEWLGGWVDRPGGRDRGESCWEQLPPTEPPPRISVEKP